MPDADRYNYCPYDGSELECSQTIHDGLPFCRDCGFVNFQNPRPCVAVLIFNQEGKVLLARRGVEPAKGEWDLPGGFIEPFECAEDSVVREILEETTQQVRVIAYLGSVPDTYGERGVPTLNLCFIAEVVHGEPRARSDVAELTWFSRSELPGRMAFAHQQQMLAWCRERMNS